MPAMKQPRLVHGLAVAALTCSAVLVPAQAAPPPAPESAPQRFVTRHELATAGGKLAYTATAGETVLRDGKGEPRASFFTWAYTADGADPAQRPITFVFNGGPGSASVWLHLGLVGPKRVVVPSDAEHAGAPPYGLRDNTESILDVTDLVCIDPIGTGFSRALGAAKDADFWGFDEDAASIADFIRRYLTENRRWASPKYLLGESYGGTRGALLLQQMQGGLTATMFNGAMFVSPAFDLELVDGTGSDLEAVLLLPTLAAVAAYHRALPEPPEDLDAFLQEARRFAREVYQPALFAGQDLPADRRAAVLAGLHRFTGLSEDYLDRARLRLDAGRFQRELLRSRGLVVGRLDGRFTGTELNDVGELPSEDPMGPAISGAYVATFLDYVASELEVRMDRDYQVFSPDAGGAWQRGKKYGAPFAGWFDVKLNLGRAMASNPKLRLFVASGLYDHATTFFAAEYVMARPYIDRQRVTVKHYPSGHMMYLHQPSLQQLAADLRAFVTAGG